MRLNEKALHFSDTQFHQQHSRRLQVNWPALKLKTFCASWKKRHSTVDGLEQYRTARLHLKFSFYTFTI